MPPSSLLSLSLLPSLRRRTSLLPPLSSGPLGHAWLRAAVGGDSGRLRRALRGRPAVLRPPPPPPAAALRRNRARGGRCDASYWRKTETTPLPAPRHREDSTATAAAAARTASLRLRAGLSRHGRAARKTNTVRARTAFNSPVAAHARRCDCSQAATNEEVKIGLWTSVLRGCLFEIICGVLYSCGLGYFMLKLCRPKVALRD